MASVSLAAMCAIDALGLGAMIAQNSAIRSSCRLCGRAIRIATRGRGRELAGILPQSAVVWSGIVDSGVCAATSLCTVQALFCCDEHLEEWRTAGPPDGPNGFRLSIDEALQLGRAVFSPMLRVPR